MITDAAYEQGSTDNMTIQLVRVDTLPDRDVTEVQKQLNEKTPAPLLEARISFNSCQIVRELSASSRSHVYPAVDSETNSSVVLKTPSIDLKEDKAYL
ncbi:MAG: hypothetical protein MUP09_10685 [Thiovulaceae bacterium]|nr:hypothetical protein [Sulfurimonadaceae bacterium]